jgi:hypothetical protein
VKLLNLSYWRAVACNPAAVTGLLVDLAPIYAVLVWHWGAAALVMLYWLENVVIGFATAGRIVVASVGRNGPKGLFGGAWLVAFFTVHYGIFCFAHGGILTEIMGGDQSWSRADSIGAAAGGVVVSALGFGKNMGFILALIALWHALAFVNEFVLRGGWRTADPQMEMFAPYGRVILLHIGVFVIGGALVWLGDPVIGVLALVAARAWWGLNMNMQRKSETPAEAVAS